MKSKIVSKTEIPDWDFGDVTIKKFSFGGKLRLSTFTKKISIDTVDDGKGGKKEQIIETNRDIDPFIVSTNTIAEGIHSVKDGNNYEYSLNPNSDLNEKVKFIQSDDVSYEAGKYLLTEIKKFNDELKESEKKN